MPKSKPLRTPKEVKAANPCKWGATNRLAVPVALLAGIAALYVQHQGKSAGVAERLLSMPSPVEEQLLESCEVLKPLWGGIGCRDFLREHWETSPLVSHQAQFLSEQLLHLENITQMVKMWPFRFKKNHATAVRLPHPVSCRMRPSKWCVPASLVSARQQRPTFASGAAKAGLWFPRGRAVASRRGGSALRGRRCVARAADARAAQPGGLLAADRALRLAREQLLPRVHASAARALALPRTRRPHDAYLRSGCLLAIGSYVPARGAPLSAAFWLGRECAQVNLYLSPAELEVATAPHQDAHSVFIVQLQGAKRWSVHAPRTPLTLKAKQRGKQGDVVRCARRHACLERACLARAYGLSRA
eukprot:1703592-Pleurochrysis_carterae.AAC.1